MTKDIVPTLYTRNSANFTVASKGVEFSCQPISGALKGLKMLFIRLPIQVTAAGQVKILTLSRVNY